LRIVQIGFHDTAGSMFFLSHAINKLTKHKAVSIRFLNDYLRWPTMIEASAYNRSDIRKMLYKADVIHFHIRVKPFFITLRLDPEKIRAKKTLVYYHGSMLRLYGEKLQPQNLECLPNHIATVSTPDLLEFLDEGVEGHWLPVVRPFDDILARYGRSSADLEAMRYFGSKKIVVFGHATTSVQKKGSRAFFQALTNVVRGNPKARASMIINNPWDSAIRKTASFDVSLGTATMFKVQKKGEDAVTYGCGYGLTAVEAGIFSIPIISLFTRSDEERYEKVAGEAPPLVTFMNEEDLTERMFYLAENQKERLRIGRALHTYMRKFHDEQAVVTRYLKLIEGIE